MTASDASVKPPRKKRVLARPDMREVLLDATEDLIREEGYAAATVRKIASKVGLKHQAVFYYFGTHDELLLALVARVSGVHHAALVQALASDAPLRGMWDLARDRDATRLHLELLALANHNDAIRSELAKSGVKTRNLEAQGIEQYLAAKGISARFSSRLVSILTNALARLLVQESTLGIDVGHDELEVMVDETLRMFEVQGDGPPPSI